MDDVVNSFNNCIFFYTFFESQLNIPYSGGKKEIINIVNKCKYKTSTDCNEVDIKIVIKVIEGISKPITRICNLSFQTGIFPNKMKIAKVVRCIILGNTSFFKL